MLLIKNLRVKYPKLEVLKDINLELPKGETLAIMGESGAGKTSLALSLMGLTLADISGEIIYDGEDFLSLNEEERRKFRWNKVSMVLQDINRALNPVLKILDQLIEPMLEHNICNLKEAKEKALNLLVKVGLSVEKAGLYPHQLSGGEKQRVLIAMALTNDPEYLILDEPTSALDAITRAEIIKLLKNVCKDRTVILITHDISTALKLSTKIAIFYSGRIMELGNTEEVIKNPHHPYTRGLLRSYPNMTTTKDLQGIPGTKKINLKGCPFYNRCTQKISICENNLPELQEVGMRNIACLRGGIVSLLKIDNLVKKYNKVPVLKSVSFNLDEGEILAIVGESGSGKTTLARTIMDLEKANSGDIFFENKKISKRDKNFYKNVQMIFQNPGDCISHRLNVLEAVIEPLEVQKIGTVDERLEKVKNILKDVELPITEDFLKEYPHHLSGGELQRLAIARALILEPKLLIADEITSALDASVQAKIMKLLLNLQEKKGLSIIFITHDIALARKVSDKVSVMLEGNIIESGSTCEVLVNPIHPYTQDLINSAPDFNLDICDLDFEKQDIKGACSYYERCSQATNLCITNEPEICEKKGRKIKCHLYSDINMKQVL